jgi:uroporphyrinogen decarboxylase
MNKRDRVLTALAFEEPDRVPIGELDIDLPLMEALTGQRVAIATSLQTQVIADPAQERQHIDLKHACYRRVDFDLFTVDLSAPAGWTPTHTPDGSLIDLWGRVLRLDEQSMAWVPYTTLFTAPKDFDAFPFPDPTAPGWTYAAEYAKQVIGDTMALAAFIRDPFAHAWEMFTPTHFVRWMYQQPAFIRRVLDQLTAFNVEIIHRLAEAGVDLIISGGDYCEAKGPMVPLSVFRDLIFPCLQTQVAAAHQRGLKFIKHTDGDVRPFLPELAALVDGLHSLDPSAGVDIGQVKAAYGDQLILMGNVSVDHLAQRSRAEIVAETKQCLRAAAPGGGYILSSSNSWAAGAKLDNCLAMVDTAKRYGVYPIRL